ncbi:bifunctional diguanylate cyclase/phosphodiesterase [Leptolyngbya ohadii]|uniref:bifunctional diguanylate cyclase/phosphodiesterase n=1 Tax=Leptolyngbya ohadii TaxID=1962290 RepID=UPI001CED3F62|nr:EAL domain-containing protein [Leptolyngbya ohadii]
MARIRQHLDTELANSHLINRINLELVRTGVLKIDDLDGLGEHFWRQLQRYESFNLIYFGDAQGRFIAASRLGGNPFIYIRRELPPADARVYNVNTQGKRAEFKSVILDFIDVRQRPWYVAANARRTPTWGDIFALQVAPSIDLPASAPLLTDDGELQGVVGNNLALGTISKFLHNIKVGQSGQTFILERDGELVASSNAPQPFLVSADGKTERMTVATSQNTVLQLATDYLLRRYGNLRAIHAAKQLRFLINRKPYFIEVFPYQDQWGIDWLIVVVVPESDFMAQIHANTRTTILLCIGALAIATYSGIMTTRWLTRPLLQLNQAAKEIAHGNFQQTIAADRIREVKELASSFNQMTLQLQNSFTQMRSLNQALLESESRVTQFLEALPVGVAVYNQAGQLTYLNRVGKTLLLTQSPSIEKNQLIDTFRLHRARTSQPYPSEDLPAMRALRGETVQTEDIEIHRANRVIPIEMWATPIFDEHGQIAYAIAAFQDISDRKQAESQLIYNALHDALTDLPNRNLLMERLDFAINRAKRVDGYHFAVLFMDLDRFKVINDSLGHLAGDRLLISFAHKLQSSIRVTDLAARLGGDEFIIVLEEIKGIQEAAKTAERIFTELQAPLVLEGHEVFITTSIGIVLGTRDYNQASDVIRDADIAMYRAKAQGKARYEIFGSEMHTQALKRLHLENDLRRAIERQEFVVYYQPIVALNGGQLMGFEALVRWQHPTRGLTAPGEFLVVAEETGIIVSIDRWMLWTACQQLAIWQKTFDNTALRISVNLSARNFLGNHLIDEVEQALIQADLNSSCLTLEITESMLIHNVEDTIKILNRLRERGIQTSIDDFGTGYSSLSYLHRLPVDTLKIDRSFVSNMQESDGNCEIVETILALSNQLGLAAIAEGIETQQQLERLQNLGCELGQGYFFSQPLSVEAATACLASFLR